MKKLILLITLCFMINCVDSEHENLEITHLDKMELDFTDVNAINLDFTFEVHNKKELAKLATLISEELFSKQEKNDQKLFGFILKMNNNIVKILPLTNDTKNLQNLRASSCPDG